MPYPKVPLARHNGGGISILHYRRYDAENRNKKQPRTLVAVQGNDNKQVEPQRHSEGGRTERTFVAAYHWARTRKQYVEENTDNSALLLAATRAAHYCRPFLGVDKMGEEARTVD